MHKLTVIKRGQKLVRKNGAGGQSTSNSKISWRLSYSLTHLHYSSENYKNIKRIFYQA